VTASRVFVMLAWELALGAHVYPVGAFGIPRGTAEGPGGPYVAWVPMTYERALAWRRRLANPITDELLGEWLIRGQLAEVLVPGKHSAASLASTVETLLNGLLLEVLPALHERTGG
jgi:hypothetical protein